MPNRLKKRKNSASRSRNFKPITKLNQKEKLNLLSEKKSELIRLINIRTKRIRSKPRKKTKVRSVGRKPRQKSKIRKIKRKKN